MKCNDGKSIVIDALLRQHSPLDGGLTTDFCTGSAVWIDAILQAEDRRTREITLELLNDLNFEARFQNVAGLYLHSPEHSIVLTADDQSGIQALHRTQKSLPLFPDRLQTMPHISERN